MRTRKTPATSQMLRRRVRLTVLANTAVLALSVCALQIPAAAQSATAECNRKQLPSSQIEWPTSAIRGPGNHDVWLLDSTRKGIWILANDGYEFRTKVGSIELNRPSTIRQRQNGFCLLDRGGLNGSQFHCFNQAEQHTASTQVTRTMEDGHYVAGVFDWTPLRDGFVGFFSVVKPADQQTEDSPPFYGVIAYIEGDDYIEIFDKVQPVSTSWIQYTKSFFQFASVNNEAFFLSTETEDESGTLLARLAKVAPGTEGIQHLAPLPGAYRHRPKVLDTPTWKEPPGGNGYNRLTAMLQVYQKSAYGVGIYSWQEDGEDKLYLLAKNTIGTKRFGHTDWFLFDLDKETGKERERHRLPTRAANIILVPENAGQPLAIIERSAVEALADGTRYVPFVATRSIVRLSQKGIGSLGPTAACSEIPD